MQAVLCYLDGTCSWLQLGAEFGPLPQPDQASADWVFRIQALWPCLSMLGKRRPLEALNSIVSACPRDIHHYKSSTNGVRVHCTVTCGGCQVPREIGYPLSRRFRGCTGWRIWGCDPTYLWRRCWAKRPHFTCLESQIGPPGEASENNFNAGCGLGQLCWLRGRIFFGLACAACGIFISNLGEFRCFKMIFYSI